MPMTPRTRKLALTAHVTSSVGWLGAVAAFLVLSIAGLESRDADLVRTLPGVEDVQIFGERLHVTLTSTNATARFRSALDAQTTGVTGMREVPPSLEDVFIAQLGARERAHA